MKQKNAMVISCLIISTLLFVCMVLYILININDDSINSKAIKLLTVSIAGFAFILIDVFDSKIVSTKGNMLMFRSVKHYLADENGDIKDTVFIEDISKYIFSRLQSKGSYYDVVFNALEKYKKVDKEFDYMDFTELFIIDLASSKCPYSWHENAFLIPRLNGSSSNSGPFDENKVEVLYSQEILERVASNKLLRSYVNSYKSKQQNGQNKTSNFDPHYFPKKIEISSDGHSNRRTLTYKTKHLRIEFEIYSQTTQTFGLEDVHFSQLRACFQNEVQLRNIPCKDIYGQSISINARLKVCPFTKGHPESKEQQKWAHLLLQAIEEQFRWEHIKKEL